MWVLFAVLVTVLMRVLMKVPSIEVMKKQCLCEWAFPLFYFFTSYPVLRVCRWWIHKLSQNYNWLTFPIWFSHLYIYMAVKKIWFMRSSICMILPLIILHCLVVGVFSWATVGPNHPQMAYQNVTISNNLK